MRRRTFLAATSALLGQRFSALGQRLELGAGNDAELFAVLEAEADTGWEINRGSIDSSLARQFGGSGPTAWNWWTVPAEDKPLPAWANETEAIDTAAIAHLPAGPKRFEISADVLEWLKSNNKFELNADQRFVAFGIRGAEMEGGAKDSGWQRSIAALCCTPDHTNFRCLIGVWDVTGRSVRVFTGSTVPEVSYMWRTALLEAGSNLLPTGLYSYIVGTHRHGTATQQVGALKLEGLRFAMENRYVTLSKIIVLRTYEDLTYNPTGVSSEFWDVCIPGDNIHGSVWEPSNNSAIGRVNPESKFSSAGCQVVRGAYELDSNRNFTSEATHEWAEFRAAIGIRDAVAGERRQYILLDSRDFRIANVLPADRAKEYCPLRLGSSGHAVAKYQRKLDLVVDGLYGPACAAATIITRQRDRLPETHIAMVLP